MPRFRVYGESDRGRVKRRNEDCLEYGLSNDRERALAVVADGVGGSPGGDVASRLAVDAVAVYLRAWLDHARAKPSDDDLGKRLLVACCEADARIRSEQERHPQLRGMATTLVAALADSGRLALVHAGDSRCYRWRRGVLLQLTEDHTVAQQLLRQGRFSAADLEHSPYQDVLTRALGMSEALTPASRLCAVETGDIYLLCSDGLNKYLSDDDIAARLSRTGDLAAATADLIDCTNEAGGGDNTTILLLAVD